MYIGAIETIGTWDLLIVYVLGLTSAVAVPLKFKAVSDTATIMDRRVTENKAQIKCKIGNWMHDRLQDFTS